MRLTDFAGNDNLKLNLTEMLDSGRIPHAILLEGAVGLGKKTLAAIIASHILCTSKNKPCGICSSCIESAAGVNPDLIFLNNEGNKAYTKDTIRQLREYAYTSPVKGDKRVFILADCQLMREDSQNLLLKIIEEPPKYLHFILTATSRTYLIPTLISRVTTFSLSPIPQNQAVDYLAKEFPNHNPKEIESAVRSLSGNLGLAKQLLAADKKVSSIDNASKLIDGLNEGNEYKLYCLINSFEKNREEWTKILQLAILFFRDAIAIKNSVDAVSPDPNRANKLAARVSAGSALKSISILNKGLDLLDNNINIQLFPVWLASSLLSAKDELY